MILITKRCPKRCCASGVQEDLYFLAEFERGGDAKIAPGFMFDVTRRLPAKAFGNS